VAFPDAACLTLNIILSPGHTEAVKERYISILERPSKKSFISEDLSLYLWLYSPLLDLGCFF
jgi:hypothetical protein